MAAECSLSFALAPTGSFPMEVFADGEQVYYRI
jgi:hypothetical protein